MGIDKNDNCLVELADDSELELPNSTGYNLYDTMFNEWRCVRDDYPRAFTFLNGAEPQLCGLGEHELAGCGVFIGNNAIEDSILDGIFYDAHLAALRDAEC